MKYWGFCLFFLFVLTGKRIMIFNYIRTSSIKGGFPIFAIRHKCAFVLCLLFLLPGCVSVQTPRETTSLKELCEQYDINWYWDSVSQAVTLSKGSLSAKGLVGSEVVVVNQKKVYLSRPLKRLRGRIIVPPDFRRKVVLELLDRTADDFFRSYRIVIDAGHGGKDPGAIGVTGTYEKDVVLDIAKRVRNNLKEYHYDVKMTRTNDQFISLEKRTELASQYGADLFISIHANSSTSRRPSGLEVYFLRDLEWKEKKDPQRERNHDIFFKQLSLQRKDDAVEAIVSDMLFQHKASASNSLAVLLSERLERETRAKNRGVFRAGFFVLRNTLMPAVLIEVGFLSNSREERSLNSPQYRQSLADGISKGIKEYVDHRRF